MVNKDSHHKVGFLVFIVLLWLLIFICAFGFFKEFKCEARVIITIEPEPMKILPIANENVEIVEHQDEVTIDEYYLAKIAMAEAEGEDLIGKVLVVEVVLNRVNDKHFPDTIYDVITQSNNGVYQFSPVIPGGRWYTTEPNDECWEAVQIALEGRNEATEALYFTSIKDESTWHSRNLEYLYDHGNHKFYK